ncbi:MAG: hypothetical protein C4530_17280 [Desulfobacteraceae bacterium]|nr:MAG: hypothetical protein C4530_17280 [Desulfobacteraceae bacterium]
MASENDNILALRAIAQRCTCLGSANLEKDPDTNSPLPTLDFLTDTPNQYTNNSFLRKSRFLHDCRDIPVLPGVIWVPYRNPVIPGYNIKYEQIDFDPLNAKSSKGGQSWQRSI